MSAVWKYLTDKLLPFIGLSAFGALGIWAEAPDWSMTIFGMFWCLSALNLYPDRWIEWVLNGGDNQ